MKRQALIDFRGDRSQKEMGERYGVTQQAWTQWENGDKKPDVTIMKQIEKDSGIPMEVIFFDVFNKKDLLKEPSSEAEVKAV